MTRGFIVDSATKAVWGRQNVWPFKADDRISYVSADYGQVVFSRDKRDDVWIMSRSPKMSDADLRRLTEFVGSQGYDVAKLVRVPHSQADGAHDSSASK